MTVELLKQCVDKLAWHRRIVTCNAQPNEILAVLCPNIGDMTPIATVFYADCPLLIRYSATVGH
ncbi:hypothetical protein SE17_05755 [Kouleothrix aurantiaca]|uniref:Uncharacterized protein n=1 Tax=Kouleothrix aurantiaca TaxID=186479 RepID=A0A0N8PSZ5_9CHLR|nr:hypothetical protein SE17_05755 [Kouleothrix aurantiaca]